MRCPLNFKSSGNKNIEFWIKIDYIKAYPLPPVGSLKKSAILVQLFDKLHERRALLYLCYVKHFLKNIFQEKR